MDRHNLKIKDKKTAHLVAGLTPRSLVAGILCMLLAGIYTQYSMVYIAEGNCGAEVVLPVPAMIVLLLTVLLGGLLYSFFRIRILTRAELLCVFFMMIISIPMMTQGFWHRFVGLISVPLRSSSFSYVDAYNDNLWPHGPNLLKGRLQRDGDFEYVGREPVWEDVEYEKGISGLLPLLVNEDSEEVSALRFRVKVMDGDRRLVEPENPFLVSVLAKTARMGSDSEIYCRIYADDSKIGNTLFRASKASNVTYLHQKGFVRLGSYGNALASGCEKELTVELGLKGRGKVYFTDPKVMSVMALEGAFRGRRMIGESEYNKLPLGERPAGVVIKPDNMWSLSGLAFLFSGYIPIGEWITPILTWGSYVLLLCGAFFAMNVIMRKQWAENERYPMPMTRIPLAIMGSEESDQGAFATVWFNRYTWIGLSFGLIYSLLKAWSRFNPRIPDLEIRIHLEPYFQNPIWGETFNIYFVVTILIVSIAVFFELNVLLSLIVGFWFYRFLFFFGNITNLKVNTGYPWRYDQALGGYIGYFLIVALLSRKYLFRVLKEAFKGTPKGDYDVLSSRGAVLLLAACFIGALCWSAFAGGSILSTGVFFAFLVMLGFVSSKFRAECGLPSGYFTPYHSIFLMTSFGGMKVFGTDGMFVALIISGFITVSVFYFIPGAQFELIQLGNRMRIKPRHIVYTSLLGVVGGLLIGGWVFLSNAYSIGGDNLRFQWAFNGMDFFVRQYQRALARATAEFLQMDEVGSAVSGTNWKAWTMVVWGVVTIVITLLRQFFAGFWFHPIGFILGSSHLHAFANWGSLLVAWIIRATVLKIGGVAAVRNKMQPFFVGTLAGVVVALLIVLVINSFSVLHGSGRIYPRIP